MPLFQSWGGWATLRKLKTSRPKDRMSPTSITNSSFSNLGLYSKKHEHVKHYVAHGTRKPHWEPRMKTGVQPQTERWQFDGQGKSFLTLCRKGLFISKKKKKTTHRINIRCSDWNLPPTFGGGFRSVPSGVWRAPRRAQAFGLALPSLSFVLWHTPNTHFFFHSSFGRVSSTHSLPIKEMYVTL